MKKPSKHTLNMKNRRNKYTRYIFAGLVLLFIAISLALTGCDDNTNGITKAETQLNELREATAAYEDISAAEAAGWDTFFPPYCMSHKNLGSMGVHRLNPDLVDDEIILTKPELLVYEVQADGSLRFVAVEYIVPLKRDPVMPLRPNFSGMSSGQTVFLSCGDYMHG